MQKQYKHKQTGRIYLQTLSNNYYHPIESNLAKDGNQGIPGWAIENSNDWIEITNQVLTKDLINGNWYKCDIHNNSWLFKFDKFDDTKLFALRALCLENISYYNVPGPLTNIDTINSLSKVTDVEVLKYYPNEFKSKWTILSFRMLSNSANPGSLLTLGENGLYGKDGNIFWLSLESLLHNNKEIYSVRRESDGEIFTIGDDIMEQGEHSKIQYFQLRGKDMALRINHQVTKGSSTICMSVHSFSKYKKPLFTTEDGVDIYENDEYFYLRKHSWTFDKAIANLSFYTSDKHSTNSLYFSTKEVAEEYILMNKPCLCMNDVNNVLKHVVNHQNISAIFKNMIKSRLNEPNV